MDVSGKEAFLWKDRRLAHLKCTQPTKIILAITVMVATCVKHIVLVKLLSATSLTHVILILPKIFANISSMNFQLIVSFCAFYVHFVIVNT